MASCPKCGRTKLRKDKAGRRKCRRCGFLRGLMLRDRSARPMFGPWLPEDFVCAETGTQDDRHLQLAGSI